MDNCEFDVAIIGTGVAGAVIAKMLTNAGKKVLMLEAGLDAGIVLDGEEAFNTHYRYLQDYYANNIKTPNSPYPVIKNALSAEVLEIPPRYPRNTKGYFVQLGPDTFGSDNLIAPGGTTLHWLGTTLRMLPNDFKLKTLYDQAVDWPIEYHQLKRYYEMAEFEIGVSGEVSEQKLPNAGDDYFGEDYHFPMKKIPQSYLDQCMMLRTRGLKVVADKVEYELDCISTPQGRNADPQEKYRINGIKWDPLEQSLVFTYANEGVTYQPVGAIWDPYTGQRCEGNASCVPICPVQAKYNALKTLKKADRDNLQIITQAVASSLIIDEESKEIVGIRYKRYLSPDKAEFSSHIARARVYVCAASAIENAKILLASNAANSSDQVGRNLMDHLCLLTWGLSEECVYPFRGPGSTTNIPTFRDGDFRKNHAAWILPIDNWGWGWPEFSPAHDLMALLDKRLFGKTLRKELHKQLTRQILLHFECEQLPEPENRITIDPKYKDQMDNYRPVIQYRVSEYMLKAFEVSRNISNQIFTANKITDKTEYNIQQDKGYVEYNGKPYAYWGAGHIVGTHRMGNSPKDSVVNVNGLTWDHKNLYLAGCGNMPTLGTSNPTLTMTALAFKTAEAILKKLEN